ncbi:MAG: DinB family protein [Planctomycetes bacterium]|nr:DinB family protein [Planctomycetota bacterium]
MARAKTKAPIDLGRALVEAFLTNERINQVLLEIVSPEIWRAQPPCSKRRNIATSFAHMHNVRCMRLKMSARDHRTPNRLDRAEVSIDEAKKALRESAAAIVGLIERSLAVGGHVPDHRPDVVALVCAAITHDAHHRGQICHWAARLGAPLTPEQSLKMWEWDKRWKEVSR